MRFAISLRRGLVFASLSSLATAMALGDGSPAKPKISFTTQVQPILQSRCAPCHGNGTKLGGFQIDSRESILKGGESGPAVKAEHSADSLLIQLVSGANPSKIMPASGPRLTAEQIQTLKDWIDEGATTDTASKVTPWVAPLLPRIPKIPPAAKGSSLKNPLDRLLAAYFKANKVQPPPVVGDTTYARRVYLDLVGLLPSPQQIHTFVNDPRPDKRERLAQSLLSDNKRYAEHWLTFWNDLLRNDYTGTGYIDGGREPITGWLYRSLYTNLPYDRFVWQLVNPTPESEGFIKGIVWRGVVNASQTPQMQASQNISQVFMGINMKCASCHNSFISNWKLKDSYGLAAVFAEQQMELVRCDKPTGEIAEAKFIYPELGSIDPKAPMKARIEQLANIITKRENGRLSRTLANRLWTRLMGRGLIEPNDEMDNPPWNPDLLDWLAANFQHNGYDIKKTLYQIVTSRAYQLPSMGLKSERPSAFVFGGPVVKRMSGEQLIDAVSTLTGAWQKPAISLAALNPEKSDSAPSEGHARVKFASGLMKDGMQEVEVDVTGAEVLSLVVNDGGNGASFDWADWVNPRLVTPKGEVKLTDLKWESATTGYGEIQIDQSIVKKSLRLGENTYKSGIGTHANSVITYRLPAGTTRFRALVGPDAGTRDEPKSTPSLEFQVMTGDDSLIETRASLAAADPLMVALGRPNREQVVTERSTSATTLQALEMTNGNTLARMLETGAERWTANAPASENALINSIYEKGLGRLPTAKEMVIAKQIVGSPVKKEGVEDLLWVLIMLPEFQLIY